MNELLIKIDERQLCSYLLDLAKEYYAAPDHQLLPIMTGVQEKIKRPRRRAILRGGRRKRNKQQIKSLTL